MTNLQRRPASTESHRSVCREYGLAQSYSKKEGGWVPVLETPMHLFRVLDYDWNHFSGFRPGLPGILGWSRTPRGFHLYVPQASPVEYIGWDENFEKLSLSIGAWRERLFDGGAPRPVPIARQIAIWHHALAWDRAQQLAMELGIASPMSTKFEGRS
jgi:hypothetical protein